jgi:hypothetical protein
METITLGRTDLKVSRIAFGTLQLGGEWGRFDEQTAIDAIRKASELWIWPRSIASWLTQSRWSVRRRKGHER